MNNTIKEIFNKEYVKNINSFKIEFKNNTYILKFGVYSEKQHEVEIFTEVKFEPDEYKTFVKRVLLCSMESGKNNLIEILEELVSELNEILKNGDDKNE